MRGCGTKIPQAEGQLTPPQLTTATTRGARMLQLKKAVHLNKEPQCHNKDPTQCTLPPKKN